MSGAPIPGAAVLPGAVPGAGPVSNEPVSTAPGLAAVPVAPPCPAPADEPVGPPRLPTSPKPKPPPTAPVAWSLRSCEDVEVSPGVEEGELALELVPGAPAPDVSGAAMTVPLRPGLLLMSVVEKDVCGPPPIADPTRPPRKPPTRPPPGRPVRPPNM